MWLKCALALALILGTGHTAFTREVGSECSTPPLVAINGLKRTGCQNLGSGTVERYLSDKSLSPYASEFDQRDLTVAHGKDLKAVMTAVGIDSRSITSSTGSPLLHLPMADKVSRVGLNKRNFRYRSWNVSTERIEYGAQGGAPGFQITCAVAVRSTKERAVVFTECFPLEEKNRFIRTLDSALH